MTKRMCFMTKFIYNPIHVLHVLGQLNEEGTYTQKY